MCLIIVLGHLKVKLLDLTTNANNPGFNPSILRHGGIWEAVADAVLNKELKKSIKNSHLLINYWNIDGTYEYIFEDSGKKRKQIDEQTKLPTRSITFE